MVKEIKPPAGIFSAARFFTSGFLYRSKIPKVILEPDTVRHQHTCRLAQAVHNLRKITLHKIEENYGYDWAIEANNKMKQWILDGNHQNLINFKKQGKAFDLAIPTPEHYLPLLYTLGLKDKKDNATIFNDSPIAGSLTMTSVKFG